MVYVMYFSPTGGTLKTLQNIVEGMGVTPEWVDLSIPANRQVEYHFTEDDLVLYGTITGGMTFATSKESFACFHGNGASFAGVGVYGNGYYGVSLRQMKQRAEDCGFKVVGLAAFIAMHSQSQKTGVGRPDEQDAADQRAFGKAIMEKKGDALTADIPVGWSRSLPFNALIFSRLFMMDQDYTMPAPMKWKKVTNACVGCGTCARNCPVCAITMVEKNGKKQPEFDLKKCIICQRCARECPQQAIKNTSPFMNSTLMYWNFAFKDRQDPTVIL